MLGKLFSRRVRQLRLRQGYDRLQCQLSAAKAEALKYMLKSKQIITLINSVVNVLKME